MEWLNNSNHVVCLGDNFLPEDNPEGYLSGQRFSTWDRDQDSSPDVNCAESNHGAWWFNDCFLSHLNGRYIAGGDTTNGDGIIWGTWTGPSLSLKRTEMKIRPAL